MGNYCNCWTQSNKDLSEVSDEMMEIEDLYDNKKKIEAISWTNASEFHIQTDQSNIQILPIYSKLSSFKVRPKNENTNSKYYKSSQDKMHEGVTFSKNSDSLLKSSFNSTQPSTNPPSLTNLSEYQFSHVKKAYQPSITFLGESGSGKTSFIYKTCFNKFDPYHIPTIKAEKFIYETKYEGVNIKINLFDTCGLPEYNSGIDEIVSSTDLLVYVVDLTNSRSLSNIKSVLLSRLNKSKFTQSNLEQIILGNKIDLVQRSKIQSETLIELAKANQMPYFEVSAKTNYNLVKFLNHCLEVLYSRKIS